MKPKYFMVVLLITATTSCVTIVKWKYGITNPKEQTHRKLISFLDKHTYPDSCQYVFRDSSTYFQAFRNTLFRKNLFSNMIFDSTGFLVLRDTSRCQWSGYEVIEGLHPDSACRVVPGLRLEEILSRIEPLAEKAGNGVPGTQPSFTVVVTWAKFLGKFNARLFDLSEAATLNNTTRIRMIWLNVDMQEDWNLTEDQKMEIN